MTRLSVQPPTRVATMAELVGIAHAIETEAVRCYDRLAREMHRRGESETAAAFEAMGREEDAHIAAVEGWARGLGESVPADDRFRWGLPPELAASWDEIAGSALLTPYRAYAIAVDNEQRAFAFYAYLVAAAEDPSIAREAEALAREELRHAAVLRTWRRAAWRKERQEGGGDADPVESLAGLNRLIDATEAETAGCHRLLAERLRAAGDPESAALLDELAEQAVARTAAPPPAGCEAEECRTRQPVGLLHAAQRPLERLCDVLEATLLATPDPAMLAAAERALDDTVARIARIGRRLEAIDRPAPPGK
ncbi:hypothetical protein GCM10017083_28290 [Thalassobaculum fulvum]|uniref:Rubrerythrin diiron-binding domain-containing protein n=1 Tax=Thalassobaculum fulvum TaxID=1633335 RepID=A0A918XTP5_9PROT|nr:ferritin family protein [Thalassobaculum fulvum]GHD52639.1 hypothetical protein GCM10017083_28290 [Thalassobaculum fulvum]